MIDPNVSFLLAVDVLVSILFLTNQEGTLEEFEALKDPLIEARIRSLLADLTQNKMKLINNVVFN